jgi:CRISPR system Cascade subunit CasC
MSQFIQVHFLTSYPPSNLNRDDLGRPKTAIMGGSNRLRISSQSLKRAWRCSELFVSALGQHQGIRTKRMGREIYKNLLRGGVEEKDARQWAKDIAAQFGKIKEMKSSKKNSDQEEDNSLNDLDIEQLAHFSPEEKKCIDTLVQHCIETKNKPDTKSLELLRHENSAADIACFGRMLASSPEYNVDAAVQVAHAITTHAVDIEDDYFTAVDDLNDGSEDAGAGHLGATEFACGLFYGYICINRNLLKDNLAGDEALTQKTIAALIESAAKISPTGKQNSFASRAYTSYMLVEKGHKQPRSLSVAFLKSMKENDLLERSIKALEENRENIDKVYGACADGFVKLNVKEGVGTLDQLIEFGKVE